jgi:sugar phosphate isomerase/epimerase
MRLGLEAGKDTLDLAAELGIRGVPILADGLVKKGVKATLAPLRARGLEVCQIGAFGYNPLSSDTERQAAQAVLLEQVIPLAPETGCAYVTICGGNRHPSGFGAGDAYNYTDEALDEVAAALAPLLALAEQHGVKLTIEAYLKTAICSAERFLALQARVGSDSLRCNVDVSSLYDYWDLVDPRAKVEQTCTGLAGHYGLGHLKELALQEGIHIHAGLVPLGQGQTDWAQVLRLMAPHLPDDSWAILEHVLSPEEARASVAFLRATAAEVGVTLD